jgi:hypothetical protein
MWRLQLLLAKGIEAKLPGVYKTIILLEDCLSPSYSFSLGIGLKRKSTSPPASSSMGSVPTPSCLLLTRCAWCPLDPSLFSEENKDRVAWFRRTPAQVRALQSTPRREQKRKGHQGLPCNKEHKIARIKQSITHFLLIPNKLMYRTVV